MLAAWTSRPPWWATPAAAVAACAFLLGAGAAAPALAQQGPGPPCRTFTEAVPPIHEVPWAQRWFSPERMWSMTSGHGVRVAVVDTGVDATHPQLSDGNVDTGVDLLRGAPGGNIDCDSHGTAVASLIAASNELGIGFTGLAPDAEILPVRVADRNVDPLRAGGDAPVNPAIFADGIRWAVDNGARVINVSIVFYRHHETIQQAVRYALDRDVVLVAAVGNRQEGAGPEPEPLPYPAAYDGVIGVGAIREDGTLVPTSAAGGFVDLVAPGGDVTAAARRDGHRLWTGTSFAAPFVSAAAALLLAAGEGHMSAGGSGGEMSASEVAARLYATADPAGPAHQYGHGVVNPYRALTERLGDRGPVAAEPLPAVVADPGAQARAARWWRARQRAVAIAVAAIFLGGLGATAIAAVTRGRRRRWSPTRWQGLPAAPPAVDEPERVFFSVPGSLLGRRDQA